MHQIRILVSVRSSVCLVVSSLTLTGRALGLLAASARGGREIDTPLPPTANNNKDIAIFSHFLAQQLSFSNVCFGH